MVVALIHPSFAAGEIAPALYGRTDFVKYSSAATTLRNATVNYRGGAYSRAGTAYVLRSLVTPGTGVYPPHLITFQYSIEQGVAIEIGDTGSQKYMRFFINGAAVVESPIVVTGISQAIPAVVTAPAHGYSDGDWIYITDVVGMTQVNGRAFKVYVVDPNVFEITNLDGSYVDSTVYNAYSSGGETSRVYTLATPWAGADIALLKFTESADVMTLVHPSYPPYDLARIANNEWTLTATTFSSSIDPPGVPSATATVHPNGALSPPTLACAYAYQVTAINSDGEESTPSLRVDVTDSVDMSVTAGSISLVWPQAPGAVRYNIYRAPPAYNTGSATSAGAVIAATVTGALSFGYAVGDTGTIDGGSTPATYVVTESSGAFFGVVSQIRLTGAGSGYAAGVGVTTTATSGVGSGLLLDIAVGVSATSRVPIGALFHYIGTSFGNVFVDSNIIADTTKSPPQHHNPFAAGQILLITITSGGARYTTATATIASATGSGFVGECVIVSNWVAAVVITNEGSGYTDADTLVISGDGGGATGTLTVGPQTGTFPGVAAYFQQRRVYAATTNQPDTYFMSKPGEYLNFDSSLPSVASDAIIGTPWSQQVNGIQWMVQMPGGLVTFTGRSAWQVTGAGSSGFSPTPITPTSQQAQQVMFNGISPTVPPLTVNYDILYVQSKGTKVLDAQYNFFTNSYTGTDQTVLSSHLFNNFEVTDWAWCEEPNKLIWAARCDGALLSFTYLKEQEVYGWARHDTQGRFLSLTSVTEPPVDALYCVVERMTRYGLAYYIERMDNRLWETAEDPWCLDSALRYTQTAPGVPIAANTITGAVTFVAESPVFDAGYVGAVLRIAGGIATISSVASTQEMSGTWVLSPTQVVPGAP